MEKRLKYYIPTGPLFVSHLLAFLLFIRSLTTHNSLHIFPVLSLSTFTPPPLLFFFFVCLFLPTFFILYYSSLIGNSFHIPVSGLQNSFFSTAGCYRFPAKDSLEKGNAHFLLVIFAIQKFLKPFPVSFLIACSCELSEEKLCVTKRSFSLISGRDICCSLSSAHLVFVLDVIWLWNTFFPS